MTGTALPDPLAAGREPSGLRLVDVVDRLLDRGVVVHGEIWLTVADVDLAFIGAHLTIVNPDRIDRRPAKPERE